MDNKEFYERRYNRKKQECRFRLGIQQFWNYPNNQSSVDSVCRWCRAYGNCRKEIRCKYGSISFTLDDGTGTDRTILSGIHAYYEPEELVGKTLIAITNLPPRKMMGIESCGMLLSAVNNLKDSEDEELHLLMVDDHIPAGAKLY